MEREDFRTERFQYSKRFYLPLLIFCAVLMFSAVAAAASEDVEQVDTQEVRKLLKQAGKLTKKGNLIEAETLLRRGLELNPQNTKIKLGLANVLMKQRNLFEAYTLAFEVAKSEPQNSDAFAVLGMTILNAGNFKEAEIALNNSLIINKREALAWAGLGMLDFYENRISQSLENMRIAVYLDANEPDFIFALAQISARAEKYRESAAAYREFLRISPRSDTDRRERIKGLIEFLEYLSGKSTLYEIGGKNQTRVVFKLIKDRPVIQLRVNKKDEPLNFVLDTGSGISVISQKTAEKLNLSPIARGGKAKGFGGDGKFEIVYGFLKQVEIGDVSIKNVPVYVRPFHSINENIDGYIGLSLISKFLTTIDYGDTSLTLLKKDSRRDQINQSEGLAMPLRLTSGGFLSGEVQIEGIENSLNFIVDTGASLSVISDELAGMNELSSFLVTEKIRVIGAAGETAEMPVFILPRVSFGTESRRSVVAIALDLDIINESSGFEQAGILGGNFLKNYRLTFDFQNSKVHFVPVKK